MRGTECKRSVLLAGRFDRREAPSFPSQIQDSVCLLSDTDEQLLLKFTFGVPVTVSEVRRDARRHQIVVTADSPPDVSDVSVAAPSEVQCFANKDGNGIYFSPIYLRCFML